MSIPFSGRLSRPVGLMGAIAQQLKRMNLKPVSSITVQFDPFADNVRETRHFLHYISSPRVAKTNITCQLKTNIVCDRSEPTVTCVLSNGDKVLFKCENLSAIDILREYNKRITVLAPPEPEPEKTGVVIKKKKQKRKIKISRHRR